MKFSVAPRDMYGCGYYRTILPYSWIKDRGQEVRFVDAVYPDIFFEDYVVLQRASDEASMTLIKTLKKSPKRPLIVHELDDNLHSISPANPASTIYNGNKPATKMAEAICKEVDMMVVSTPRLAEYYSKFNSNIHICKNALDDKQFYIHAKEYKEPFNPDEIRIGWGGSMTHFDDFRDSGCAWAICKIMDKYPKVKLITIGADMKAIFPIQFHSKIEYMGDSFGKHLNHTIYDLAPFGENLAVIDYYKLLCSINIDIAVAPILPTLFNGCKSNIKLLEYAMSGAPTVVSSYGEYRSFKQEGGSVLTASDKKDWYKQLEKLVLSNDLRQEMSKTNQEFVKYNYLMSSRISQWEKLYNI